MTSRLHIYAFGSICRGEIAPGSDVDLLAIVTGSQNELSRQTFSIYSHAKIRRIWQDGNPFAWHLHLESKPVYCSDGTDFLKSLGSPEAYTRSHEDRARFIDVFSQAQASAGHDETSIVFDLSAAFLGLRNFCSCHLLGLGKGDFSRGVALKMNPPIEMRAYRILERARLLCTRGYGPQLTHSEINEAVMALPLLKTWMCDLHERNLNG